MKTYNNNERQITNNTFSSMSFSNSESKIAHSKLNISYFNRVLKVGIALQMNGDQNDTFAKFDNENQIAVYISWSKAKILLDLIRKMRLSKDIHNVCIELRGGLFTVSDGKEFGVPNTCFSIKYANDDGEHVVIYETKTNYMGAYNYKDSQNYETAQFNDIELDAFETVLEEYYKAATYAVAASVMEANMYKREYTNNLINAIADKVGAQTAGNNNKNSYNNKTFLNNNGGGNNNEMNDGANTEFTQSSFEDIAKAMM